MLLPPPSTPTNSGDDFKIDNALSMFVSVSVILFLSLPLCLFPSMSTETAIYLLSCLLIILVLPSRERYMKKKELFKPRKLEEILMALIEALQPPKIFTLSTTNYEVDELNKFRRLLLCTQDILNHIKKEAAVDEIS